MRTDGFLDEGAGDGGTFAAAEGDGEVVGPEPYQALPERRWGGQGVFQLRRRLRHEQSARLGLAGLRLVDPILPQGRQTGRGAGRRVDSRRGRGV